MRGKPGAGPLARPTAVVLDDGTAGNRERRASVRTGLTIPAAVSRYGWTERALFVRGFSIGVFEASVLYGGGGLPRVLSVFSVPASSIAFISSHLFGIGGGVLGSVKIISPDRGFCGFDRDRVRECRPVLVGLEETGTAETGTALMLRATGLVVSRLFDREVVGTGDSKMGDAVVECGTERRSQVSGLAWARVDGRVMLELMVLGVFKGAGGG